MNKFLTKVISICTSLVLCISMVPTVALAQVQVATPSTVTTVSTGDEFLSALNNAAAGDIIDLGGKTVQVNAQTEGDDPLIISKAVTIQNGELSLRPAGIVQGANLTLKNLQLTFQNPVRNGIFANGYSLNVDGVTKSSSATYSIHIVMGPVKNATFSNCPATPVSWQMKPTLTISGSNGLGNIYMSFYDDIANDEGTAGFYSTCNTVVTVDPSCSQVFDSPNDRAIYACGASERRGTGTTESGTAGDEMIPNSSRLGLVQSSACINLYEGKVKKVYGDCGQRKDVPVNYDGGANLTDSVILDQVGEINVKSGVFQPAVDTLSSAGIITGPNKVISVAEGATLIAGNLGSASIYNFSGGGTIALGKSSDLKQELSISGAVSGTTKVVFGDTNNFWKEGVADSVYIKAPNSSADSFTSEKGPSGATWVRNDNGEWLWSTTEVTHEHTYGYVSKDDNDHYYQCTDPGCPDPNRDAIIEEHSYADENTRKCDMCDYERIIIKDIFTPKDDSKMEKFKARVYNALLHCEKTIDVSDIGITYNDIVFTNSDGKTYAAGSDSLRYMLRDVSPFQTICVYPGNLEVDATGDSVVNTVTVPAYHPTWTLANVSKFEEAYEKAMATIKDGYTDFQKAVALHEWLCDYVDYGNPNNGVDGLSLGAFLNGKAICAGYAYAYQFLCTQVGLDCRYVAGKTVDMFTSKEISHAWNKVEIDGYWFWVDTTWDGSYATTSHSYMLCNDTEWKTAGTGGHANDKELERTPPENTNAYFANNFWKNKTSTLTEAEISQDPQLTIDCEHTWDAGVVTTEPKCETKGVKTYTCTSCKATKTEDVEAKGHSWNEGVITTKPTCQATGIKTFSCSACSETKTEVVEKDANAHNIVEVAEKAATCTEVGWNAHSYCNIEGCTYQRVAKLEIPALGHKLEDIAGTATNASCTEAGKHADKICSACKDESTKVTGETINPLGHDYGEDDKCTRCSAEKPKDPCNHETTEVETTKEATCTEPGSHDLLCTKCYEYTERNIVDEALGHDYKSADNKVEATCVAAGHEADEVCSRCNDRIAGAEITAKGHSWNEGEITTKPTCQATGIKTFSCTACSETKTEPVAKDANAHNMIDVAKVTATCTEAGHEAYSYCSNEGCTHATEKVAINPLGHDYKSADNKVEATCVAAGHEADEVCSRCNDRLAGAEIPATGKHTYVDGVCSECGAKEETKTETFKPSISISNGANVTLDKTEYKAGETAILTYKGKSEGNNVSVIKSIKVNGIVLRSQDALIDKSKWASSNSEYTRKMGEDATSVEYAELVKNIALSNTVEIKNMQPSTKIEVEYEELVPVYRLYNMITSEHMFTTNKEEYDKFVSLCKTDKDAWIGEGINWFAPTTGTAVHRLYNAGLGALGHSSHYYTADVAEIENLKTQGWTDDGTENQFMSGGDISIWTCYNEALGSAHHYTSSKSEWSGLKAHGWALEEDKNGQSGVFKALLSAVS